MVKIDKGELIIYLVVAFTIFGLVVTSYYAEDPQPGPKSEKEDKPHLVDRLPGSGNQTVTVVPNPEVLKLKR